MLGSEINTLAEFNKSGASATHHKKAWVSSKAFMSDRAIGINFDLGCDRLHFALELALDILHLSLAQGDLNVRADRDLPRSVGMWVDLKHGLVSYHANNYQKNWFEASFTVRRSPLMSKRRLPETTARVRVTQHSWQFGQVVGEVTAGDFCWEFEWRCREGNLELIVEPALGRALIQDALGRFLKQWDYQLEAGGDYEFTVRANF
jgi:hypothetical protein